MILCNGVSVPECLTNIDTVSGIVKSWGWGGGWGVEEKKGMCSQEHVYE